MSRLTWTEADERITWRRWVGWKHNLDDPEVLPFHLRDASRDQPRSVAPYFDRARAAKHRAPAVDDEEPSPAVYSFVIPVLSPKVVCLLIGAVAVIGGVWAARSLMGAS